jgi:signal transduction histidine kinase
MSRRVSVRWLSAPVFGWRDVGIGDLALAAVLTAGLVASTGGLSHPHAAHVGAAAALASLLMTVPVAFARRAPLVAAATIAIGAGVNWVLIGHMVRCGAALPAAFYVAFTIGSRCATLRDTVAGMLLVAVNIGCQAYSDPQLGADVIAYMVPIAFGFLVAGRLLQGRNAAVARLRDRTAELREQREQNARLAVAADQARIAGDLDGYLHDQIGQIAAAAAAGQDTLAATPDRAQDAFVSIQDTGRETLAHMRGVVAGLREQAPTEPQPVLAQLDRLLSQAMQAETRLQVTGDPRLLPPGVELSGYRIVEHLLVALEDDPAAQIDVGVAFEPDELVLTVVGPSARRGDVRAALAAATERAALHGGSLRTTSSGGRRETVVLPPLAAGHV